MYLLYSRLKRVVTVFWYFSLRRTIQDAWSPQIRFKLPRNDGHAGAFEIRGSLSDVAISANVGSQFTLRY
jgi:hypothetical protein